MGFCCSRNSYRVVDVSRSFLKALSFDSNCAMARVFLSPNYNNPNGLEPGMARDESLALDTIEKIEGGWPSTDLRAVYKEFGILLGGGFSI